MRLLNNKIVKNGIWLYVLLFVNTVLPMFTVPYVTRVLGAENYGYYTTAMNWTLYLHVIVTYGFDMVGSRHVATKDYDTESLQQYVSSIVYAKLILTAVSALLMIVLIIAGNYNFMQSLCIGILFISVVGEAFKQTWLFQGLQIMQNITIISATARIITTIGVFLFVDKDGLYLYCVLYSVAGLLTGFASLGLARYRLKIQMIKVSYKDVLARLNEGFILFTTNAMAKVFSGFGITVLGMIASIEVVGSYGALYKIPSILLSCFSPISQVIYPYICGLYKKGYEVGKKFAINAGMIICSLCIIGSCIIILNRYTITQITFGSEYILYADLLIPFMVWLCCSIGNNFLSTQILIASGESKAYSKAFTVGVVALLLLTILMGQVWGIYGIAWAQAFSEIILMVSNVVAIHNRENYRKRMG